MKKKRRIRRLTILVTVLIIAISLGIGIYLVSIANRGTPLDANINQPVPSSLIAAMEKASLQPYGPAPSAGMLGYVQKYNGTAFVSTGKPVVVYIGGEFCQYCAVERWAIVIAMMRFGNFTNLHYMTSATGEHDYATFTFVGSSYTSDYISFDSYEAEDRSGAALQTVPSNYSVVWEHYGSGFPFVDFGNTYATPSSVIVDPSILQGKNWTQIINAISTSDATGLQIREAANLFTSLICNITQGSPAVVCTASPIAPPVSQAIAAPAPRWSAVGIDFITPPWHQWSVASAEVKGFA